jgi:hypothetical protein
MPRICEFHGITIFVHWRDHNPPHFHAVFGDKQLSVRIDDLSRLAGRLPRSAERQVWRWAGLHEQELLDNWALAQAGKTLKSIDPLD